MRGRSAVRVVAGVLLGLAWQSSFGQLEGVSDGKISVSFPPTRLERMLPLIGEKTGLTLSCTAQLRDEVLVLVATETSGREILQKIASVTNSTWRPTHDGLVLEQTAANEQTEVDSAAAYAENSLVAFRDQLQKDLPPPFDDKAADKWVGDVRKTQQDILGLPASRDDENQQFRNRLIQKLQKLAQITPVSRLLRQMLLATDLHTFFTIPAGETRVYSLNPTRMQLRLPAGMAGLVAEFKTENARLQKRIDDLPALPQTNQMAWVTATAKQAVPTVDPSATVLLAVDCRGLGNYSFTLTIVNPKGDTAIQNSVWMMPKYSDRATIPLSQAVLSEPLEIPPTMRCAIDRVIERFGDSSGEIPEALRPYLRDPVSNEILSLSEAALLPQVAGKAKMNLIALVPDSMMSTVLNFANLALRDVKLPITVRDALNPFTSSVGAIRVDNGWLLSRSDILGLERTTRADRTFMKRYLSILDQKRTPTIDEWLSLAGDSRFVNMQNLLSSGIVYFVDAGLIDMQSFRDMSWFAKMSPSQRQMAISPGGCDVASLSVGMRKEIERVVFYNTNLRAYPITTIAGQTADRPQIWRSEPTLAFPDGLPADARIFVKTWTGAVTYTNSEKGSVKYLDPGTLGFEIFKAEKQGMASPAPKTVVVSEFLSASSTLTALGGQRGMGNLNINVLDLKKKISYSSAPREFLDMVRASYESARKQNGG